MAQINFPAASESPWYNPDNGVTYEYIGGTWRTVTTASQLDDIYVKEIGDTMTGELILYGNPAQNLGATPKQYVDTEITNAISGSEGGETGRLDGRYLLKAGDNMTGNLTLGTDKITLGTDGSATFASAVQIDDRLTVQELVDTNYNVNFAKSAAADFSTAGSKNLLIASGGADLGGGSSGAHIGWNVSGIKADAYLAFGGDYVNPFFTFSDDLRFGTTPALTLTEPTILLKKEGSAVFAGEVVSGTYATNSDYTRCSNGQLELGRTDAFSSSNYIVGTTYDASGNPSENLKIFADGSAEFAGDVFAKQQFRTQNFYGQPDNAVLGVVVLRADGTLGAQIAYDGSAEFTGDLKVQDFTLEAAFGYSNLKTGSSGFWSADNWFFGPDVSDPTTAAISLNATTGNAEFTGSVESTGGSINANAFYVGLPANNATRFSRASNGSVNSPLYIGNARILTDKVPTIRFELEPDNDANYVTTTDVDEEGNTVETRVYNGPTLDVKDRLQNVLSRIDAIEANEVADDATDSALLQLVASLTARLDEKDAAIASLTATLTALTDRVTTLES